MDRNQPNPLKHFLTFALLGPLLGLAIIDIGIIAGYVISAVSELMRSELSIGDIEKTVTAFFMINLIGIVVAYFIGFIPAALTGLLTMNINGQKNEKKVAAFTGAAVSVAMAGLEYLFFESLTMLAMAPISAVSAACCAAIKNRHHRQTLGCQQLLLQSRR